MARDRLIAGWSRRRFDVRSTDIVLDVGCGAYPNVRADVACDRSLGDDRHRTGRSTVVDRPFVIADAGQLPFRAGAFDFVVASHIAEHVEDPESFCDELIRVARRGYIETPSPLADYLLDEEYHRWRVDGRDGTIRFRSKKPKSAFGRAATDLFYAVFYADRVTGEKYTMRLPEGPAGRACAWVLLVLRGVLNRSGLMHTRVAFGELGLAVEVLERPRITFVGRNLTSGFMRSEIEILNELGLVETFEGGAGLRSNRRLIRAVLQSTLVVCFFASRHALVPALMARLLGRRVVVVVGGYDVAADREHHYGSGRGLRRFLPRAVIALADVVFAFTESAAVEARALAPGAEGKIRPLHLALRPCPPVVDSERELVVTAGWVDSVSFSRKGIDRFLALARANPDRKFVLIGSIADDAMELLEPFPTNCQLRGYVSDRELFSILGRARIYVQLSWHEGFGMAVVDAMACGATPLIADQAALREVAGEWAVISEFPARDQSAFEAAWSMGVDRVGMGAEVRRRFSRARRKQGFAEVLKLR